MVADNFTKYESRFTKSADGTEIYTDAAGNRSPDSPVIVLIHGLSMVKATFDPIFEDPLWTSNAFLIRYDTRGHGRSGKPTTDEAWESKRIAEDFEAVCKEFDVKQVFVLGWSIGSSHFVDIATYNTSITISGFINVAGAVYLESSASALTFSHEGYKLTGKLGHPLSVDEFQVTLFDFVRACSEELSPELFRILLEGVLLQPRSLVERSITRSQDPEKFLHEARAGNLPVLVLVGGRDKLVNPEGLKAVIQRVGWQKCTYRYLENADHMPWISTPEVFRGTVLGWVKGNPATALHEPRSFKKGQPPHRRG